MYNQQQPQQQIEQKPFVGSANIKVLNGKYGQFQVMKVKLSLKRLYEYINSVGYTAANINIDVAQGRQPDKYGNTHTVKIGYNQSTDGGGGFNPQQQMQPPMQQQMPPQQMQNAPYQQPPMQQQHPGQPPVQPMQQTQMPQQQYPVTEGQRTQQDMQQNPMQGTPEEIPLPEEAPADEEPFSPEEAPESPKKPKKRAAKK